MEKILVAMDALKPDKPTVEFASYLARLTKSKLVGIFLENKVSRPASVLEGLNENIFVDAEYEPSAEEKNVLTEKNIQLFREKCTLEEVPCRIHRDRGVSLSELIAESRFADLIIISAGFSFGKGEHRSDFRRSFLRKTECPVIIAPESFEGINEIIFTYDGSESAVFAIKQFTYLFPQFSSRKATIVRVSESGTWDDPEKHQLNEWLKDHYSQLQFVVLSGEPGGALFDFLLKKTDVFLVMGAYGRSTFSRFFRQSSAELIIRALSRAVFITHH